MSKFATKIQVDISAVIKKLPAGSHVHNTKFHEDGHVEVVWENDAFRTPYTFPTDFPVANLESGKVPDGVTIKAKVAVPSASAEAPPQPKVVKVKKKLDKAPPAVDNGAKQ